MERKIQDIVNLLSQSYQVLKAYKADPVINIDYLEAIAKVRFAIMEIAAFLHSHFSGEEKTDVLHVQQLTEIERRLMELAKKVCTDHFINSTDFRTKNADMFGPGIYLLKLLARQYGFPLLKQVSEKYVWIIPEGLRTTNLVGFIYYYLLLTLHFSEKDVKLFVGNWFLD